MVFETINQGSNPCGNTRINIMSRLTRRECLYCGEKITGDKIRQYCNTRCSKHMNTRKLRIRRGRVSSCCNDGLIVFPDENGKMVHICVKCEKRCSPAKLYLQADSNKI